MCLLWPIAVIKGMFRTSLRDDLFVSSILYMFLERIDRWSLFLYVT